MQHGQRTQKTQGRSFHLSETSARALKLESKPVQSRCPAYEARENISEGKPLTTNPRRDLELPCLILTQHLLNVVRELVQLESSHRRVPVVCPNRTTQRRPRTTSLPRSRRGDCSSFGGGLRSSRGGGPLTENPYRLLLIPFSGGGSCVGGGGEACTCLRFNGKGARRD